MSNKILCLGSSGTGKSSSLRNLDEKETFVLQCVEKRLPFKGSSSKYNKDNKNLFHTKSIDTTIEILKRINSNPGIKTVIIDDFNYLMTYGYKLKAKEKGFEKFENLAFGIMDILEYCDTMRDDLNIYFMAHTQSDQDGNVSTKTIGKFLDEKLCIEGLFTIVTLSLGSVNGYKFVVNGTTPAKSPMEMFETSEVENDLNLINETIKNYY